MRPHPAYPLSNVHWNTQGLFPWHQWGYEVTETGCLQAWAQSIAEKQTDLLLGSSDITHQVTKSSPTEIPWISTSFPLLHDNSNIKKSYFEFGLSFSQCRHLSRLFLLPVLSSVAHLDDHKLRRVIWEYLEVKWCRALLKMLSFSLTMTYMLICDFLHQRGKLNVSITSLQHVNPFLMKSAQVLSNELFALGLAIPRLAFHDLQRAVTQKQSPERGDLVHSFPQSPFEHVVRFREAFWERHVFTFRMENLTAATRMLSCPVIPWLALRC